MMSEATWDPGERGRAVLVAVTVLGAVLCPLRQLLRPVERRKDGFPLSYYPMFSTPRRQHAHVAYAVGVAADGTRRYLPHTRIGTGGLNQVRRQLYRIAITDDRAGAWAPRLAARLAANPACDDLVRVDIIRGQFDLDKCLLDHHTQGEETILASVELPPRSRGDASS